MYVDRSLRPHTTADAWSIGIPACPRLVSDTGPLSRSPEGTPGAAVLVSVFHRRYDPLDRLRLADYGGSTRRPTSWDGFWFGFKLRNYNALACIRGWQWT